MNKLIIAVVFCFLGITMNAQANKKVTPTPTTPSIQLESNTVDYGIINKGANGVRTFKVSNKGSQPLLITTCEGSCGCTVPTCPKEPIMPGKTAQISIKYDTQRPGPFNKTVTIKSNDPTTPVINVIVQGEIKETGH